MKKSFYFLLLLAVALAGCNFSGTTDSRPFNTPAAEAITATEPPTILPPTPTDIPSPLPPSATPSPAPQSNATSSIFPVMTLATDAVCRMGPDQHYYAVLRVAKGKSFEVSGRNADSSWLAIQATPFGDDCWVPVSSLGNPGDLSALNEVHVQSLPGEPMNVTASANACGVVNPLWMYWVSVDAVGYRIYRNGKEIATVYGDKYRDLNTPRTKLPTVFLYEIEGFNASGVSGRTSISVTICG